MLMHAYFKRKIFFVIASQTNIFESGHWTKTSETNPMKMASRHWYIRLILSITGSYQEIKITLEEADLF